MLRFIEISALATVVCWPMVRGRRCGEQRWRLASRARAPSIGLLAGLLIASVAACGGPASRTAPTGAAVPSPYTPVVSDGPVAADAAVVRQKGYDVTGAVVRAPAG